MPKVPHPICASLRELRKAAGLSLTQMEELHGISAVLMGSYERGDRIPPLPKIDSLLGFFGYKLAAVPLDHTAVRIPSDMVTELRAIASQIARMNHTKDEASLAEVA